MRNRALVTCLILLLAIPVLGLESYKDNSRRSHSANIDFGSWIDANRILMFVTNKGSFAFDNGEALGKSDGLYYPYTGMENILNGSNTLTCIFAGSIWMGAEVAAVHDVGAPAAVGDTVVTSGQHATDWGVGPLDANGAPVPGASTNPIYRVYSLYSDSLADNPNQDYLEWPVDQGAPVDASGNPEMMGDQMHWSVYNDMDLAAHGNQQGTVGRGLGIEVRQTAFAFAREGALANIVFLRFRIYNKGPYDLTNMFVSLWSDPDLGDASDDLVGCDTILSLGYCYNEGDDQNYGSTAPAVGYDFFQGPLVFTGDDADTAIMWNFTKYPQYTNLGMVSFNKYINGTDPDSPTQSYWYMLGLSDTDPGQPLIDPNTGDTTLFYGSGDPVAGTGFLDFDPADRRWMQNTGPFDFNQGDSTEVVAAVVVGRGANELASITELKTVDEFAQSVYDREFILPRPPASPDLSITPLNRELSLIWGTKSEDDPGDYPFEGYALFQGPTANGPWDDTLGWWDVINEHGAVIDYRFHPVFQDVLPYVAKPGLNFGLSRALTTTRDVVGGGRLINYNDYFYRLEAYSVDTSKPAGEKTLTSATIMSAMPQSTLAGTDLWSETGDTIQVDHTGPSDGFVTVAVVDPTAVTGDSYKVAFTDYFITYDIDTTVTPPDTLSVDTTWGIVWHLINTTTGDSLLNNQTNQGDEGVDHFEVTEGLLPRVFGPPLEGNLFEYESAEPLNWSPVAEADNGYTGGDRWMSGDEANGGELLFGAIFMEPNFWGGTSLAPTDYKVVELHWRPMASYTDLNGDGEYSIGEPYVVDDPGQTQGAFMYTYFTAGDYEGFFDVPFTAWDVSDPGNPRQLNVVVRDRDQNQQWDLHNQVLDSALPNLGDQQFNYVWILDTDYDPTGTMYGDGTGGSIDFWDGGFSTVLDGMWALWLYERGDSRGPLAEECVIRLTPNFINSVFDEFTFTSDSLQPVVATSGSSSLLDAIKAVPNPYYLSSTYDFSVFNRRVKFINLPEECTISIYNLGGDLVTTVEKNNLETEAFWDLENDFGVPVGSGIYIYVVDSEGFGQHIGKMAVFTEVEVLEEF